MLMIFLSQNYTALLFGPFPLLRPVGDTSSSGSNAVGSDAGWDSSASLCGINLKPNLEPQMHMVVSVGPQRDSGG